MSDFHQVAEDQGWNETTQIGVLLEYIENQQSDEAFSDFLQEKADEENSFVDVKISPKVPEPETFFAYDLHELTRPKYANVWCLNKETGRVCYAYQSEHGNIFAGYQFSENDFSLEVKTDEWLIFPLDD